MKTSVIVSGARTPIGRLLGAIGDLPASELGGIAMAAALKRAGIEPSDVGYVVLGQVLTAGAGQLPARQAAVGAGIPMSVPATTVSKVCLSGIQSIIVADQFIRGGDQAVIVAGGQESMSTAPRLVRDSRTGVKLGSVAMADHLVVDGLQDAFTGESMGSLTERMNEAHGISRRAQDEFAARSHARAAAAWDAGIFDDEVIPVPVRGRRGEVLVERDEGIRATCTPEQLAGLPPAFSADGTVTAGNASSINDGACALVIMEKEAAERTGTPWLAEIRSHAMVAGPDSGLHLQPANAIRAACAREGIEPDELDLVEINEAFAAVVLASCADLSIGPEKVNVNGGAIALGHPIGMSGARIVLHLALELRRRGGGIGAAALCGGGGQGDAVIIRVPKTSARPEGGARDVSAS